MTFPGGIIMEPVPDTGAVWVFIGAIVLGVLVWFVVLFAGLTAAFAWGSGWRRLAERYRAVAPPAIPLLKRHTVRVGGVRYRRSTTVGLHPDGLYLAVRLPFHPPLWIPWSELGPPREARIDLGTPAVEMSVGEPALARLAVTRALYEQMAPYLRQS
jgi:hypothetical protein